MQSPTKNGDDGNYHEDEWDAWNYVPQENSSNGEHKQTEEDNENAEPVMNEVETLRLRAQELINAKAQFDEDLKKAKVKYSDDVYILSIEHVINDVFSPQKEIEKSAQQERNPSTTNANESECEVPAEFQMRPEEIDHLELIEYLNSSQARIDMPDIFGTEDIIASEQDVHRQEEKQNAIPSFSLGIEDDIISQVCEDIEKTQTAVGDSQKENDDDFITPKPAVREKSTRIQKMGKYLKSPYTERVIDISSKYTNQDLAIWIYMIQKNNLLDDIFTCNGLTCLREHMQTLKLKKSLYYSVIDTWTIILNDNENYKADESPMCFFCPIGSLHSGLNVDMSITASYPYFAQNMDETLKRYTRKLDNLDMVFFPINKYGHFYVICDNLRKEACDLIDNIKRGYDTKTCYGQTPSTLHSHFARYLEENGLVNLAKRIRKLKPNYLKIPWQTQNNSTDCGIFVMRHMETYKGDARSWDTGLHEEGKSQGNQIFRLRVKYNHAILASNLNEKKDSILKESKELFNLAAEKRLSNLLSKSSNKENNIKSTAANKKNCHVCNKSVN